MVFASYRFAHLCSPSLRPVQALIPIMVTAAREIIGLRDDGIIVVPPVCHFSFVFSYLLPNACGGSALNLGSGYNRGGTSRNPSRAYLYLVLPRRLITSRVGMDLPMDASRNHFGQPGEPLSHCTWIIKEMTDKTHTQRPIRSIRARVLLVTTL